MSSSRSERNGADWPCMLHVAHRFSTSGHPCHHSRSFTLESEASAGAEGGPAWIMPECRAGKAVAWTTRDSHELRANAGGASPTWRTAQVRRHFRSGKLRAEVTLFRLYGKYSSETTVQTPRTCGVAVRVCGHTFAVPTLQLKVQQKRERNAKGHERNDCVSQHDVFSRHDSPRFSEKSCRCRSNYVVRRCHPDVKSST